MEEQSTTENLSVVQTLIDKWETDSPHLENLSEVPLLSTALGNFSASIATSPVSDYGSTCFLAQSLLSPAECQALIRDTEAIGFADILHIRSEYRGCQRIVARAPQLANELWRRVEGLLAPLHFDRGEDPHRQCIHGVPYMLSGSWRPVGLNPIFRVCRYEPGEHFGPHYDGHLVRDANCRSMQTLMLYLNEDFTGGSTNFIKESQGLHSDEAGRFCAEEANILCRVQPNTGLGIIFNHYRLHEGEFLRSGRKYILRTDIMFQRSGKSGMTEREERALELLQQAERYENHKEMDKAVDCYRRAFKLCPELETCT